MVGRHYRRRELHHCDGSGDGGIDIAYLKRADIDTGRADDNSEEGDVWYVVQSKYGTSFSGSDTILTEGNKIISTLAGQNQNLSQDTESVLEKLKSFLEQASAADRIVLVLATVNPIPSHDREALDRIKIIGRDSVSRIFDVEELSLRTLWEALEAVELRPMSVPITGQFVEQTSGLLVGTVSLLDLFEFMRLYQRETGDLNQLYEKNVRQFLGGRRKINKGIANTLNENPEKFGLYNNGITVVVSGYSKAANEDVVAMNDPYVVNGCQTTRTVWQVLDGRLNAGGTGSDSMAEAWKERARRGGVVTKIVSSDEAEITNITRYTNSQNSVRERDFIALNSGFQGWAGEMAERYQIFMEIQRGGAEARRAWEKQHPDQQKYSAYVNAFDLIKVYGAGWMSEPGLAFGKNTPFLPNGSVYERIVDRPHDSSQFGVRDFYAAYKIKSLADDIGFGRQTDHPCRRQSRFLFYHVIMQMLANVILLTPELRQPAVQASDLTDAALNVAAREELGLLATGALGLIDQYLTVGTENSAFTETAFTETHHGDLNAFLKSEELGKQSHSPKLVQSLAITNAAFNMAGYRERVAGALVGVEGEE